MRPWGFWATLGFAALAFGLGQAVALASMAAWLGADAVGSAGARYDGGAIALVALTSNPVEIVTLVLAARLSGANAADYLALNAPRRPDLMFGVLCLAALIVIGDAATLLTGRELVPAFQIEAFRTAQAQGALIWLLLALVVAAPAGEEILFRGFLFRGWMQSGRDPWTAIILIALIWSLLHVQYDWFGMTQVFVTGLLFGWLRWRSGSATLVIVLHFLLNLEGTIETVLVLGFSA